MTTPITKERLIKIQQWRETYGSGSNVVLPAEEAEELACIALAAMNAKPIYQVWDDGKWCDYEERLWRELYDEHSANMFRIVYSAPPAPAVNAEPVADVVAWHKEGEERTCDIRWRRFDVAPGPLFAVAPPAAVVPDEMEPTVEAIKRVLPTSNPDEYAACIGADMWNACRAAMLQAGNAPVIGEDNKDETINSCRSDS